MITVTDNSVKAINAALIANNEALKKEVAQSVQSDIGEVIDDNIISQEKTWSSSKINNNIVQSQFFGFYIDDDTTQLSGTSYTFNIANPAIDNMPIGSTVRLTFKNELQSSQAITSVNLNLGGHNAIIKVARDNAKVNVKSHQFIGGQYNAGYPHKVWDKYTTFELMYDGSDWIVMGNPVFCSDLSSSKRYQIYANGIIEQSEVTSSSDRYCVCKYTNVLSISISSYIPNQSVARMHAVTSINSNTGLFRIVSYPASGGTASIGLTYFARFL